MIQSTYETARYIPAPPKPIENYTQSKFALSSPEPKQYLPILSDETLVTEYHDLQRQIGINGGTHPLYYENPHWAIKADSHQPHVPEEHAALKFNAVTSAEILRNVQEGTHSVTLPPHALLATQNYTAAIESFS